MEQIFLSILVFTGLVLILVSILNFAESKLLPQGDIRININGENDKDIVTCAPFINYKHVGTNIHISDSNINIYKNCSYPWWMYSLWRCWRISDHDVDLYYTRLKKHKW